MVIDESINHIEILNDNFNLNLSGLSLRHNLSLQILLYRWCVYFHTVVIKLFTTNDCDEPVLPEVVEVEVRPVAGFRMCA